jgi:hypothetical protein
MTDSSAGDCECALNYGIKFSATILQATFKFNPSADSPNVQALVASFNPSLPKQRYLVGLLHIQLTTNEPCHHF